MSNVTLTDFLLARIAEDEEVAQPGGLSEDSNAWHAPDGAWYPSRVLAECEAKRRIIEMHPQTRQYVDDRTLGDGEPRIVDLGLDLPAELLVLASVYADHPDYRQEWRL